MKSHSFFGATAAFRLILPVMMLFMGSIPAAAVPGISASIKKTGQELTEYIAKKLEREQAEELSSKTTRELAAKVGRSTEEVQTLLTRYGDDATKLLNTPQRAKLSFEIGDDASRALIKHGQAAENVLQQIPSPELARAMNNLSREEARSLNYLISKGLVTRSNSSRWSAKIQQHGGGFLKFAASNLVLASVVAACCLSPDTAADTLSVLYDIAAFAGEHPFVSLGILLLLSSLYILLVQWLTKSPITLLRWLGLIIGGGLWRLLKKLFRLIIPRKTPPAP